MESLEAALRRAYRAGVEQACAVLEDALKRTPDAHAALHKGVPMMTAVIRASSQALAEERYPSHAKPQQPPI